MDKGMPGQPPPEPMSARLKTVLPVLSLRSEINSFKCGTATRLSRI